MNTEIITEAKPHTIKKFELIERYVDEWARKILGYNGKDGREGSKGIIYIDCMSNSGVYRDENGNQIDGTALRVAKKLNDIVTNYPGILQASKLYIEAKIAIHFLEGSTWIRTKGNLIHCYCMIHIKHQLIGMQ